MSVSWERNFYEVGRLTDAELEECVMARWWYHQFQVWFQSTHVLMVNGRCYEPMAAFGRSLVQFMAALCWHKYKFEEVGPHHKNFTYVNIIHVFGRYLTLQYPELCARWKSIAKEKPKVFHWNGPKFEVRLKGENTEVFNDFDNFEEDPWMTPWMTEVGGSADGDEVEDGNGGEQG